MRSSKTILAEIRALGPLVRGSLVESKVTCGKPGCRCARGEPHRAFYLSRRVDGRTRMEYVTRGQVETVRAWSGNHDRMTALVEELTGALLAEMRRARKR
jgi:hypothetical protein